jgi:sterol desaturase/sphingolipid hydroxylase (fatty acid hydroxylase superfamily)
MPMWVGPAVVAATFLPLLAFELLRPLRPEVEPKMRRLARNAVVAALGFGVLAVVQTPALRPLWRWMEERHVGLLHQVELPRAVEVVLAVILLDYTLWHWHWLNHRVPFLWRFHLVHHVDRDLDASTALRFHFGEMALSVPYRMLQIAVIGADAWSLGLWQALLLPSILFHHSNVRLPVGFERALVRLIVTPRMHGIHHSAYENETNSNWSSLLSAWDYLHGTVLLGVPQRAIDIGVPAYRDPEEVTLGRVVSLPFRWRDRDWTGPDGERRHRPHPPEARRTLAA